MSNRIEDWALNAYADGEVDAVDRAAVERQLADDADTRLAMDGIRRQKAALHSAYDSILEEPVPAYLLVAAKGGRNWHVSRAMAAAAAVLMFAGGSIGGWYVAHETRTPPAYDIAQEAIAAHEVFAVEVQRPVEIAAADKNVLQHWLSKRIGVEVQIPDITSSGYELVGGRLLTAAAAPAGQLMYEASNKERLTIFFGTNPTGKEEAVRVLNKDGLVSCYWQERDFSFAVTGNMPVDDMMKLAKEIYDQVEET